MYSHAHGETTIDHSNLEMGLKMLENDLRCAREEEMRKKHTETQQTIQDILSKEGSVRVSYPNDSQFIRERKQQFATFMKTNHDHFSIRRGGSLNSSSLSLPTRLCFPLIGYRFAMTIDRPRIGDFVTRKISYKEVRSKYPSSWYASWEDLIASGLIKDHLIRDRWISFAELLDIPQVTFQKLFLDLGFSLDDMFDIARVNAMELSVSTRDLARLGLFASDLVGLHHFGRIHMMDRVSWSISSMVNDLKFTHREFQQLGLQYDDLVALVQSKRGSTRDIEVMFNIRFVSGLYRNAQPLSSPVGILPFWSPPPPSSSNTDARDLHYGTPNAIQQSSLSPPPPPKKSSLFNAFGSIFSSKKHPNVHPLPPPPKITSIIETRVTPPNRPLLNGATLREDDFERLFNNGDLIL